MLSKEFVSNAHKYEVLWSFLNNKKSELKVLYNSLLLDYSHSLVIFNPRTLIIMKKINKLQLIASITLLLASILQFVEVFINFPKWLSISTTVLYLIAIVLCIIAITINVAENRKK